LIGACEELVAEGLEPDAAAVKATDDAVDRSPLPDRGRLDACTHGQPLCSGSQVVADESRNERVTLNSFEPRRRSGDAATRTGNSVSDLC
jgi:hypothetical protein